MGRLENFIPKLEHYKLTEKMGNPHLEFEKGGLYPTEPDVAPFLKQVNGHQSLKEIFLFLKRNQIHFNLEKSIEALRDLANLQKMKNHQDFFSSINGPSQTPLTRAEMFTESYFSRERLVALIQKTTLFMKCDRKTAEAILNQSRLEKLEPGFKLIAQNSKSSHFFVSLTGGLGVYRDGQHLASLGPLAVFGESAAIFDKIRNADVVADHSTWVLRIQSKNLVDHSAPETFESFKGLKSRLLLNQTLSANPIFSHLPSDVMQLFISQCRIEKYGREQMVVQQGETTGDFYFVLKGSVSIIKDHMPVTSLAEGEHFGEIAALFNQARSASVVAESDCVFLVLNQMALMEVLSSHFRLAIDIEKTAEIRKSSKNNILQLFDYDGSEEHIHTTVDIKDDDQLNSFEVNQELLEVSSTNFDLELVDFSDYSTDPEDEAI